MPLIGNRQCRSVHQIENRFRDAGLEPRIVFRSDDNGTIQELVAAGVGAALVPLLTVDPAHEGPSSSSGSRACRPAASASPGTATATARRRRGPSSTSPPRCAPASKPT